MLHSFRRLLPLFLVPLILISMSCNHSKEYYLLAGTYTNSGSKGIYSYKFNVGTGQSIPVSNTDSVVNPSFVAVTGDYVFAVNETNGDVPGSISSFSFDKKTGTFTFLNKQPTGGDDPCYLEVSKDGKWVAVANYSGGSLALFPILENGRVGASVQLIQHTGTGPDTLRQEKPHVHQTVFSPDGNYLFVPDLGLDKIFIYKFDPAEAVPLTPAAEPFVSTGPASGPRHITFSPNGKFAFCVHELDANISTYSYNDGKLTPVQVIPGNPRNSRKTDGAEVKTSGDGKFLYVSYRANENSIATFSLDEKTGHLTYVDYKPTGGIGPRDFSIDPSGKFLLAANQNSDNIVVFKRDDKTGSFTEKAAEIVLPKPVCITFAEAD